MDGILLVEIPSKKHTITHPVEVVFEKDTTFHPSSSHVSPCMMAFKKVLFCQHFCSLSLKHGSSSFSSFNKCLLLEPSPPIVLYTDGSCLSNVIPSTTRHAGIGVWVGQGHLRYNL
ncbi:hypothetical protein HMI55_005119 [Coelomomyces lativittatus]|nr:hypothetical protein HMI56_005587 [Coelomomyces lativittatus]KAJ1513916.1 hypothetical protein HMI55_005119 [Coelomomyces lativittatus]